jgi:dephospho-CoA kinase
MIILGVTGSIGSGKSFFCQALSRFSGVRLISSDAEVHWLYENDRELLEHISQHFPKSIVKGKIDRKKLGDMVFSDVEKKKELEDKIYPLLRKRRHEFIKDSARRGTKLLVLEIPLLFENDLDMECDYTLTVFCNPALAKNRVLKRGMNEEKYKRISSSQMDFHKKLKYSDYHFNSGRSKEFSARAARKLYIELMDI